MTELTCFKAYDIRGRLGDNLDEGIVHRIGRAFAEVTKARTVVVGRDCRASSQSLLDALCEGLMEGGTDVLDLGLCGTEEVYFATTHLGVDGGLEVTASHNPMDYNGIKMVLGESKPLGNHNGMAEIKAMASSAAFPPSTQMGARAPVTCRDAYAQRVIGFCDLSKLRPLKIVVNAGNGTAGPTFDAIADGLAAAGAPLTFIRHHHTPDGTFPNGIPNPLLEENRPLTADVVRAHGADLGVAWDGDFDRCFFFDETGAFIDGEYIVGLLAASFLDKEAGARIVHDPRITWNTIDLVTSQGGEPIQSRTGHAFLKQIMREKNAVYGGEMSAHHYFRDFMFCDSGMIPWVLVVELMGSTGQPLSALVADRQAKFPSSGEINFRLADAKAAIADVVAQFEGTAVTRDDTDGISLEFPNWRFNLRSSNTEPVVRLNAESRGDRALLDQKVAQISAILETHAG
ncbi:MAG: phosphomannomutase [Pseudomonadota bacterium]